MVKHEVQYAFLVAWQNETYDNNNNNNNIYLFLICLENQNNVNQNEENNCCLQDSYVILVCDFDQNGTLRHPPPKRNDITWYLLNGVTYTETGLCRQHYSMKTLLIYLLIDHLLGCVNSIKLITLTMGLNYQHGKRKKPKFKETYCNCLFWAGHKT